MFHENIRQCNVIMEQRIVKKAGNLESLKYFFKLVGAFSVIYLNLCQTRCENCLKFKRKNQQLGTQFIKRVMWSDEFAALGRNCVFGIT